MLSAIVQMSAKLPACFDMWHAHVIFTRQLLLEMKVIQKPFLSFVYGRVPHHGLHLLTNMIKII